MLCSLRGCTRLIKENGPSCNKCGSRFCSYYCEYQHQQIERPDTVVDPWWEEQGRSAGREDVSQGTFPVEVTDTTGKRTLGVWFVRETRTSKWVVHRIDPDSKAATSELKEGDRVMAFDDINVEEMTYCDGLRVRGRDTINVTVLRHKKHRKRRRTTGERQEPHQACPRHYLAGIEAGPHVWGDCITCGCCMGTCDICMETASNQDRKEHYWPNQGDEHVLSYPERNSAWAKRSRDQ